MILRWDMKRKLSYYWGLVLVALAAMPLSGQVRSNSKEVDATSAPRVASAPAQDTTTLTEPKKRRRTRKDETSEANVEERLLRLEKLVEALLNRGRVKKDGTWSLEIAPKAQNSPKAKNSNTEYLMAVVSKDRKYVAQVPANVRRVEVRRVGDRRLLTAFSVSDQVDGLWFTSNGLKIRAAGTEYTVAIPTGKIIERKKTNPNTATTSRNAKNAEATIQADIELLVAQEALANAEQKLSQSKKLFEKGYIGKTQLEAEKFALEIAIKRLELAKLKLATAKMNKGKEKANRKRGSGTVR